MLSSAAGRQPIEEQLDRLMRPLLQAIVGATVAAVREAGLQTLLALLDLPQARLAPHKADVVRSISTALDDPKRRVRQAAVKCRQAWSIV